MIDYNTKYSNAKSKSNFQLPSHPYNQKGLKSLSKTCISLMPIQDVPWSFYLTRIAEQNTDAFKSAEAQKKKMQR
jgi:hypothetical protein